MARALTLILAGFATCWATWSASADDRATIRVGFAKCAHCTPVSLMPGLAQGIALEAIPFNTAADATTALVSKSVDIVQTTYLSFASALDRGLDLVAISGHVNGGSQILLNPAADLAAEDWTALKAKVADAKARGTLFRVAASRGSAQDLHMRGALAKHGIEVGRDVQFVNVPNPADHLQALRLGEVDLLCTVEPFASQIRLDKIGSFFTLPYDQAAGTLTGLFVTRPDVIAARPKDVEEAVRAWLRVDDLITRDKAAWVDVIVKLTGAKREVAEASMPNLFPDRKIHLLTAVAIAGMMRELKYVSRDVSNEIVTHTDYRFLEAATGRPRSELGD